MILEKYRQDNGSLEEGHDREEQQTRVDVVYEGQPGYIVIHVW